MDYEPGLSGNMYNYPSIIITMTIELQIKIMNMSISFTNHHNIPAILIDIMF